MHTVTVSIAYGYSLYCIRLQRRSHTVTSSITYGYSLDYIRLQVAALFDLEKFSFNPAGTQAPPRENTYLANIRLQPLWHAVTAFARYGYNLC